MERIKELNIKARQFTDAFIAIQTGNDQNCSPWGSPRLLSPVDVRNLVSSKSTENLTEIPNGSPSRPKWVRRSLRKRKEGKKEYEIDQKRKLEEEAISLLQNMSDELKDRLESLGSKAGILTPYEAKCLVALLYCRERKIIEKALVIIANCAAFSVNLDFLREVGCIHRLCALLQDPEVRLPTVQTLGNVVLSEENIRQARDCLPFLMEFVQNTNEDEGLKLASLIVLTNLATTSDWHEEFCPLLYKLYQLVDSSNHHIQLQSLRLLVNLACNRDMIPSLLAAEGPRKLCYLVSMETADPLLLRTLTLLSALSSSVKYDHIDPSLDLPPEEKAASPETMYARLFGVGVRERLLSNAHEIMMKHEDTEINRQALKLYESLKE
ncbi:Armadillo repeat-containing protein 10 [Armadillidium nasatum]|uniref:Armadillo repeat-containing protein 10 n=1 Tax=Armadillidium nasatum TaxID=96803 RepID=A0A5N5SNP3_9CRUS|nr:Armadillo repeat-containing protein 10 [Armadillidium nasatum]